MRSVVIQSILNLRQQDTCQFLFNNMISCFLQIRVNGKVDVIAGFGFLLIDGLDHLPHAVYIQLNLTLLPLQIGVHSLLQTGFADDIRLGTFLLLLLAEIVVFLLGNLSDIADDIGKAVAIRIAAHGFLFNIDTLKLVQVLHDIGHRLLADILGDGGGNVLLITVQSDRIADIH